MIGFSDKYYGVYVQNKDRRKFIGYVSIPVEFDGVELQKSYSLVKITRECRIKKEQVVEEV